MAVTKSPSSKAHIQVHALEDKCGGAAVLEICRVDDMLCVTLRKVACEQRARVERAKLRVKRWRLSRHSRRSPW